MAALKAATTCLHWSQPINVSHSPSSSQTLASAISSPSSKRRSRCNGGGAPVLGYVQRFDRSPLFGTQLTRLYRFRSCEFSESSRFRNIIRACSANLNVFSDEEFSKKIQGLALRFQLSEDGDLDHHNSNAMDSDFVQDDNQFPWPEIRLEPLQWQEGFREAGGSTYCSVKKKAFSSMVFIIRELHSYTLQMRQFLCYEDLHGILNRVQKEKHASFAWHFQQGLSHTPTLMVYAMILLAYFTVYSMGNNTAIAASPPPGSYASTVESASVVEVQDHKSQKFDSSAIKIFPVSSSSGKTTSIGGNNGDGGKVRQVASGTDSDGRVDGSGHYGRIVPDGASKLSYFGSWREAESMSGVTYRVGRKISLSRFLQKRLPQSQKHLRHVSLNPLQRVLGLTLADGQGDFHLTGVDIGDDLLRF